MIASDVLSRSPLLSDTNTISEDTEHFIDNIISYAVPLSVSFDEIKSETLSDPDLCSTIKNLNTNFWDKDFKRVRNENCKKFNFVKIKYISYSKIIEKKNFRYCTLISFGNSQDKRTIERKSLVAMYRPRRRTFD